MKMVVASLAILIAVSAHADPSSQALSKRPSCASVDPCGLALGHDVNVNAPAAEALAIPAPGTLALIGLGLTGLVIARNNRK